MAQTVSTATRAADLHTFLEEYERDYPQEVVHVERPLDAEWELTALCAKLEKEKRFPVIICHNVVVDGQRAEMPLMTFLMSSRLRLARAFGADVRTVGRACFERAQQPRPPVVVPREDAPVKQVVETGAAVDVRRFPAPRHHAQDPGRYITGGFVQTFNRETRRDNCSMQRGWLAGRDEIRVLIGLPSHNNVNLRQYEAAGEDMPVAYWIGHHPLVQLGAQLHVGPADSHFETAGGLLGAPLRLVASETLGGDFLVPADAEVVIEGYVPHGQRKPEGPFGEYTRYVGPQRWCPFIKVTAVTYRRDAIWDDVMVGHTHWISLLTNEGQLFRDISRVVPGLRAVYCPMAGCAAHVYVQIRKTRRGQGRLAATAALTAGAKHAFVFDDDVDIFDEKQVLQALAWRFQGDRDLVVVPRVNGTTLDPSGDQGVATRLGFDCTKPVNEPFAQLLSVPSEVSSRIDPAEIIGRARLDAVPVEPWG
jgi:2,5-furandicarboxylate decarboxylase 1